ncbi:MAG: hypothetical protein HYV42_00585 [Candidatus Magasanikbacteria bacterium]|nr:hypothetical protein [Candidatus Magasanikbacteria bacterium]
MCFPIGEDSRHILCEVKGTIAGGKVATVYLEKIDPCEVDDRRLSEDGWRRPAPSQGEGWGWPGG